MVASPKRGEIFDVNFNPARGSEQAGVRPAIVVQNNVGNTSASTTIVAAISSQIGGRIYPFEVLLDSGELPKRSLVMCNQLMTVTKERLGKMMGVVSPEVMEQVDAALRRSLALSDD